MPVAAAVIGALLGFLADRLSARWPSHEDGSVRPVDWRTPVLVTTGAVGCGVLAIRWPEVGQLTVLGAYFALLLVLMAIDLDQRLLPDVLTLPLIPVALVLLVVGRNPMLEGKELAVVSAVIAAIAMPVFLLVTNAIVRGGLGGGDVKLAVGLGLMSGFTRLFSGFIVASAASSIVLIALLVTRRLSLKTAIPFGPILIAGGMLAAVIQ
jgi:leader peptidase (prepilin peptidase)/N-methyltransferase